MAIITISYKITYWTDKPSWVDDGGCGAVGKIDRKGA